MIKHTVASTLGQVGNAFANGAATSSGASGAAGAASGSGDASSSAEPAKVVATDISHLVRKKVCNALLLWPDLIEVLFYRLLVV